MTAKEMMARLAAKVPDAYAGASQLRTLQRRVRQWRAEQAKNLILGAIKHFDNDKLLSTAPPANKDSKTENAAVRV